MGNRSKYKRLPDLYIRGKELVFKSEGEDDLVMWLQVLNPFEAQECRNDANAARGRLTMALKTPGSDEYDQLRGQFLRVGRDGTIEDMLTVKNTGWFLEATQSIEVDPEWKERMEVLRSADIPPAEPLSDDEQSLLAKLNAEYMTEINKRVEDEHDYYKETLTRMSDEELMDEFVEVWIARRGDTIALIEYNLSEVLYGTRVCEAKADEDGTFTRASHAACNHEEKVYETREEVRLLPEEMQRLLRTGFDDLAMSARDAKSSGSKASSSDSSPVPEPQEDSSPSTSQEEDLSIPLGT